jgi:hypothetical protein
MWEFTSLVLGIAWFSAGNAWFSAGNAWFSAGKCLVVSLHVLIGIFSTK